MRVTITLQLAVFKVKRLVAQSGCLPSESLGNPLAGGKAVVANATKFWNLPVFRHRVPISIAQLRIRNFFASVHAVDDNVAASQIDHCAGGNNIA